MATEANQTVHSGHTIQIKYNDTVIGRIQGLDGERSFGTEPVYEIGSIMPQEHIYNRYEGSLSVERFFVRKDSLKDVGLTSLGEEVLKKDILSIVVVDRVTKDVVRSYHGCSIVNYRETFRTNAIAGENATFTYLFAGDGSTN